MGLDVNGQYICSLQSNDRYLSDVPELNETRHTHRYIIVVFDQRSTL